ncbi:MAG: GGDEF domain-containing protein [Rhodospirillales bacterium]|nr:GGDEF domain-containing protein [Rhodospirillales bacterium]
MTDKKSDFENSIADLHVTASHISGGLQRVLSLLEDVIGENADILNLEDSVANKDKGCGAVLDSIGHVRDQIRQISEFSSEFDRKIASYGDEIVELKIELEKNKKDALIDPLTGIANRRRFEQVLSAILEDMKSVQGHLSVLLGDIDDFKEVNDTLGHAIGDQVLKLVAHAFAANLKQGDFVARWAGDEFAAILPSITPENATVVAQRVRDTISSKSIRKKNSTETLGKVTMSFGIASAEPADTVESLIERADRAMYQAKNSGKNMVSTGE